MLSVCKATLPLNKKERLIIDSFFNIILYTRVVVYGSAACYMLQTDTHKNTLF